MPNNSDNTNNSNPLLVNTTGSSQNLPSPGTIPSTITNLNESVLIPDEAKDLAGNPNYTAKIDVEEPLTTTENSNVISNAVVGSSQIPTKYGGSKIIATIFGVILLVAGVATGVYLVNNQQELRERASSGAECSHSTDCILLDSPGNQGSFTAPRTIDHLFVTAREFFRFDPPGKNDECYNVTISGNAITWARIAEGPDCKDISNIQIWLSSSNSPSPVPTQPSSQCSVSFEPSEHQGVCWPDPRSIEVKVHINSLPSNPPYYLERDWYVSYPVPNPEVHHYDVTKQEIKVGETYTINMQWPGFKTYNPIPDTVEIHAGANIRDNNGIISPNCSAGLDYFWTPYVCPIPSVSVSPTEVPKTSLTPTGSQITASCSEVRVYSNSWEQLNENDMSLLSPGDVVRITVSGTASGGTFTKARFIINGVTTTEVTSKKPGSNEFYYQYTIPNSVTNYSFNGEVYHSELGWI